MSDVASPVVLITGAAGGLGHALADEFRTQSWRIAAGWHRAPCGKETDAVWPLPLDVTDGAQADEAIRRIVERWGRLDVLINNAGLTADAPLWQLREAQWDAVLKVNLKGAFHCARAAAGIMVKQHAGHVINIASFAARSGPRGQAAYAASKAGLIGLTQSLARELGARNVRVNAVLPGVLPTPMTAPLGDAVRAAFAQANALGRLNSVAEVARFIVFLAGLENISGQVFQLDSRISRWT
jgi:3-oxoacyl-[acyl-carrier protein] reductase